MKIDSVSISGFKTIANTEALKLGNVNIFIGANGSGKSNIVSFFEMISFMMTNAFERYTVENGFASSMLYHGQKITKQIQSTVVFSSATGKSKYDFRIAHSANDKFVFLHEKIEYLKYGSNSAFEKDLSDGGYKESKLKEVAYDEPTAKVIRGFLSNIRVFHFHDTSKSAYVHQASGIESNSYLMSDGGNLASFLYRLKEKDPRYYDRIVDYIQLIAPFFDDFVLEPQSGSVSLRFKEKNSELEQGSTKLSDGTLRFICLATLLLQPKYSMPGVIIIDEPELGLHPMAIDILSEMVSKASKYAQVFLTTQSQRLLDNFEAESVIVIDRAKDINGRYCSAFSKLDEAGLQRWLKEYALSDLWDSNIIGGRP